jgi:hypothetical protein
MGHVDDIASTAFFLAGNESGSVRGEGLEAIRIWKPPPDLCAALSTIGEAAYEKNSLSISEREAARMHIA